MQDSLGEDGQRIRYQPLGASCRPYQSLVGSFALYVLIITHHDPPTERRHHDKGEGGKVDAGNVETGMVWHTEWLNREWPISGVSRDKADATGGQWPAPLGGDPVPWPPFFLLPPYLDRADESCVKLGLHRTSISVRASGLNAWVSTELIKRIKSDWLNVPVLVMVWTIPINAIMGISGIKFGFQFDGRRPLASSENRCGVRRSLVIGSLL